MNSESKLNSPVLMVVDDEPAIVAMFRHIFLDSEISIVAAETAASALKQIKANRPDAVMLDVVLPDGDGLDVFKSIRKIDAQLPVVIMTSGQDGQTAIEAMQQGAMDYLVKPLDVMSLNKVVRRALEVRRLMVEPISLEMKKTPVMGSAMIGCSSGMQEVFKAIGRVAAQSISILIRGESGTGKELVARAIFQNGLRKAKPFVAINCAAIPEALLESELFGHEKGSFTGADRKRIGKIEQCDGGTLFLDEIGDMEAPLQSKLLRVLQEKEFERVGGSEAITTDVRILAATHQDIEKMCEEGKFREDLYYRLNGYTINLPSLRERNGDIELLIEYFRQTANKKLGKEIGRIAPEAMSMLKSYHWPGNVRQLESVVHQAVVQSSGTVLLPDFLPPLKNEDGKIGAGETKAPREKEAQAASVSDDVEAESSRRNDKAESVETVGQLIERHRCHHSTTLYDDVIEEVERELLAAVLNGSGGNLTEAAKQLGITRTTVRNKVNKLGIGIRKVVE